MSAPGTRMNAPTRTVIVLVLGVTALVALYPLWFMLLTSLKTANQYLTDPLGFPTGLDVSNFLQMAARFDIVHLFANSLIYCAGAWALSIVVALPAAYALGRIRFVGSGPLLGFFVVTMAVPGIAYLVPLYTGFAGFGLIDTGLAVVLVWGSSAIPGTVFLLASFMRSIPRELLEAAEVDGAGYFRTLLSIVVPLAKPGIITVTVFNVTTWWNDLLTPLVFLQSSDKATVTLGVTSVVSRYSTNTPLLVAGLLLASIPPILTYLLCQRYIREGLVLGAVK